MMLIWAFLLLTAGLAVKESDATLQWKRLIATFGIPLEPSDKHFVDLPRLVKDAVNEGWRNITRGGCNNFGKYNGYRYIKGDDFVLALLFDVNGYIAGIQINVLQSDFSGGPHYPFYNDKHYIKDFVDGKPVYTLTSYFVNPGDICTTGRTEEEFSMQGTGTEVFLQSGRTPNEFLSVPRIRTLAYAQYWGRNMCFTGMGLHSYYYVDNIRETNCTNIMPYFTLFDQLEEQMMGIVFYIVGNVKTDPNSRFEVSGPKIIRAAVGPPAPQCLMELPATTIHIWFVDKPWEIRCP